MGDMSSLGGAVHREEIKVEGYFKTHVAATAIGVAVAVALVVLSVVIFFHV